MEGKKKPPAAVKAAQASNEAEAKPAKKRSGKKTAA
jgi:hypothetical protein